MSIISYAQNFEDVMLWRALGHVERGLYVDIGAQHPLVDSVSMAFHQAGWEGVHIEPVPAYADMLREARPGDTVLQVALGADEGILDLHVIDDSGLSTAVDAYAEQHAKQGAAAARHVQVPMLTLKSALRHLAGRDVHWLKIDVEGFEAQVLRGWDSSLLRPWVMVVEATRPGSPDTDFADWDPLVTAGGYRFVYFDGLNRFYVADEHAALAAAFAAPPNVFDGAQLNGTASASWCHRVLTHAGEATRIADEQALWLRNEWQAAKAHGERLEQDLLALDEARAALALDLATQREFADVTAHALTERAEAAERKLAELDDAGRNHTRLKQHADALVEEQDAHLAALTAQWTAAETALEAKVADLSHWSHHWFTIAEQREQQRLALMGSASWRLTAPLRGFSSLLRHSVRLARRAPHGLRRRGKALAGKAVRASVRLVLSNQRLSQFARGVLGSHPALKAKLRQTTVNADVADRANAAHHAGHPAALTERAGRIYLSMRNTAVNKDA